MPELLEFEEPIGILLKEIEAVSMLPETEQRRQDIMRLQQRITAIRAELYGRLTPWQRVLVARHPSRPTTLDYIEKLFTDFVEIRGDRRYADDHAMVCGLARYKAREVLVVGAGPVGLTLAIALGQAGVRCALVERKSAPQFLPKMERCNARTMEIFRRMGIAARVRAAGLRADVPMDVYIVEAMNRAPLLRLPYPSVDEARRQIDACTDGSLPLEPYQLISQYTLEPLLKSIAEELRQQLEVRRLATPGARTGKFKQRFQELHAAHVGEVHTRTIGPGQRLEETDALAPGLEMLEPVFHVDRLDCEVGRTVRRTVFHADATAGAVFDVDLQRETRIWVAARVDRHRLE